MQQARVLPMQAAFRVEELEPIIGLAAYVSPVHRTTMVQIT